MVVIKFVFFLILFYFIARSAGNLVRAALNDPVAPRRVSPRNERPSESQWHGSSPQRSRAAYDNVEDAKWTDL